MSTVVARLGKPHGIRGECTVEVRTDAPEERFVPGAVFSTEPDIGALTLSRARWHRDRLLLTFEEIADRTAADSLRGMQFFAEPREDEDDEGFYDHELEGLRVLHGGEDIGEVTGITHGPHRNLLEVTLASGRQALVPFVEAIVPEVDLGAGTLTITPPEGLLDL